MKLSDWALPKNYIRGLPEDQDSAGLPVLSPGDHEYDLSSVPDGKSLLDSMYVLSLAIYNLTACSHTLPVLSPGDHEYVKERVSMFTLHAVRL